MPSRYPQLTFRAFTKASVMLPVSMQLRQGCDEENKVGLPENR